MAHPEPDSPLNCDSGKLVYLMCLFSVFNIMNLLREMVKDYLKYKLDYKCSPFTNISGFVCIISCDKVLGSRRMYFFLIRNGVKNVFLTKYYGLGELKK